MNAVPVLRLALSLPLIAGLFFAPGAGQAAIGVDAPLSAVITVSSNLDQGPGSLRAAIKAANDTPGGDKIVFAVAGPIDLLSPLPHFTGVVTVLGNGATVRGSDFAELGVDALPMLWVNANATVTLRGLTILSAFYQAVENRGDLRIEDCTFQMNHALYGGAIRSIGKLFIKRSTFSANTSEVMGPAIYNTGAMRLQTVRFKENRSYWDAGAIYSSGEIEGLDVYFDGNRGDEDSGGALYNDGRVTLTRAYFSNNGIHNGGGAIWNNGRMTLNQVNFTSNFAKWGGAIFNWRNGELTINGGAFTGNNAAHFGGGLETHGVAVLNDVVFSGNRCYDFGGAMYNNGDARLTRLRFDGNTCGTGGALSNMRTIYIEKSYFGGNTAERSGGGFYNSAYSGEAVLVNNTFSGNRAAEEGGGIYSGKTLDLSFTTLAYNQASSGGAIFNSGAAAVNAVIAAYSPAGGNCAGNPLSAAGSLSDDAACAGFVVADPRLLALETVGATSIHRPALNSPALDLLPSGACAAADDQIGTARPQGAACDSGAVESRR